MKTLILFTLVAAARGQIMLPIVNSSPPAMVSFTGVGDISASGAIGYRALRAWSSATRGNRLINLCDTSGANCADISSNTMTGLLNNPGTLGSTNCATSNCHVAIVYDLTIGTACGGGPCDYSQMTDANRPVLVWNSGNPYIQFASGQNLFQPSGSGASLPYSSTMVAERTGSFTTQARVLYGASQFIVMGFDTSANTITLNAGNDLSATAADSAWHAAQGLINGSSSALFIDGTNTTGNAGTNTFGGGEFGLSGTPGLIGNWREDGWWAANTSANAAAITTNQRLFWGF